MDKKQKLDKMKNMFRKKLNSRWFEYPKIFLTRLCWRLQFKKVKLNEFNWTRGRCFNCDAGDEKIGVECSDYYCPCDLNEHLKRVRTFKCLKK